LASPDWKFRAELLHLAVPPATEAVVFAATFPFFMLRSTRWLLSVCWLSAFCPLAQAQDSTLHRLRVFAEFGGFASSANRLPFWMTANQFGIVPIRPQPGLAQVGVRYDQPIGRSKRWGVETALEGVVQSQHPNLRLIVPEAFARVYYKKWELVGGRRRQIVGMQDSTLSSGGVLWSGNTLPIPQIRIGTAGFISLPFLKRWVKVSGFYSHGWFENSRPFVQNFFLHAKSAYLIVGKDTWSVQVYGGMTHMAQWGGYAPALKDDNGVYSNFGRFESSWGAYWDVVMARSGQAKKDNFGTGPGQISSVDVNRVGNHVGSLDVGLLIRLPRSRMVLYRQHLIEDGSLFYLLNIVDGLNGVRWYRTKAPQSRFSIDRVTGEFLYTLNQGGPVFDIDDPLKRGMDDYYNHSQYRDGWSYFGRTLGTPLIPPDTDLTAAQRKNMIFTSNNRVKAFHIGAAGTAFGRVGWETKLTYTLNWGTYRLPLTPAPLSQFSGLVRARTAFAALGGLEANVALGLDKGGLYDAAVGMYLGLRKAWHCGRVGPTTPAPKPQPRRPSRTVSPQRF